MLREQIAHQPRPARLTRDISPENVSLPDPLPQPAGRERPELRVRVWDQELKSEQAQSNTSIEDLPTQETPASPTPPLPGQPMQRGTASSQQEQERRREQIAQQSTSFMSPVTHVPLSEPRPTPFFGIQDIQDIQSKQPVNRGSGDPDAAQHARSVSEQPTLANASAVFPVVPPTPALQSVPATPTPSRHTSLVEPVMPVPSAPRRSSTLSPRIASRGVRRGPGPLVLLGVIILVLLIAGVAWVTIVQPFTVPPVTNPLQRYRDTHLGFALSYPTDWDVTHSATSVQFSDSSKTAMAAMNVLSSNNAPSANVTAYLQAQATKLGMTGAKAVTQVSFAGTKWQLIQGSVQKNGVNETEALFATLHNNKLLVLTQLAPQNVYAAEESVIFSKMRASLHLL